MAAATIMYDRARRLDLEDKPTWDERYNLLEFQLEAYTHAIHALCLLDSRDAWIAVGTSPDAEGDPASGFGYGYQSNNMAKNRDSEIVELEDVRRESELCRARRELLFRMYTIRGKMADEGNYRATINHRTLTVNQILSSPRWRLYISIAPLGCSRRHSSARVYSRST